MTINEYQAEALRTAAGMNHPNGFEADRRVTYDTGRTY